MANSDLEWVSCSKIEFGPVGSDAHLILIGQITTLCGATATYPDIWRRDSRKSHCKQCSELNKNNLEN